MQVAHANNGTRTACAACKHQRKRCDEKCILAPFFPADRTKEFQAVHKVFGLSNLQKMVQSLNDEDKRRATDSLVWEAFCRQKDPILGPYGEYRKLYDELNLYRSQFKQPLPIPNYAINTGVSVEFGTNNAANASNTNVALLNYVQQNVGFATSNQYTCSSHQKLPKEGEMGSIILPVQQRLLANNSGYHQQYCITGQFSPINGDTAMESITWEGGS